MKKRKIASLALASLALLGVTGCSQEADTVSENLSVASDNFEVERRIVFFNGITDKYLLTIEGLCSIKQDGDQLEVTCKTGEDEYKKHYLGLSDNVSYFLEQIESEKADAYHYRVVYRPETAIPDVDLKTDNEVSVNEDGGGNK